MFQTKLYTLYITNIQDLEYLDDQSRILDIIAKLNLFIPLVHFCNVYLGSECMREWVKLVIENWMCMISCNNYYIYIRLYINI